MRVSERLYNALSAISTPKRWHINIYLAGNECLRIYARHSTSAPEEGRDAFNCVVEVRNHLRIWLTYTE